VAKNAFFVSGEQVLSEKGKDLTGAYRGNCVVYTKQKPLKI
jgi:hypothetical protein